MFSVTMRFPWFTRCLAVAILVFHVCFSGVYGFDDLTGAFFDVFRPASNYTLRLARSFKAVAQQQPECYWSVKFDIPSAERFVIRVSPVLKGDVINFYASKDNTQQFPSLLLSLVCKEKFPAFTSLKRLLNDPGFDPSDTPMMMIALVNHANQLAYERKVRMDSGADASEKQLFLVVGINGAFPLIKLAETVRTIVREKLSDKIPAEGDPAVSVRVKKNRLLTLAFNTDVSNGPAIEFVCYWCRFNAALRASLENFDRFTADMWVRLDKPPQRKKTSIFSRSRNVCKSQRNNEEVESQVSLWIKACPRFRNVPISKDLAVPESIFIHALMLQFPEKKNGLLAVEGLSFSLKPIKFYAALEEDIPKHMLGQRVTAPFNTTLAQDIHGCYFLLHCVSETTQQLYWEVFFSSPWVRRLFASSNDVKKLGTAPGVGSGHISTTLDGGSFSPVASTVTRIQESSSQPGTAVVRFQLPKEHFDRRKSQMPTGSVEFDKSNNRRSRLFSSHVDAGASDTASERTGLWFRDGPGQGVIPEADVDTVPRLHSRIDGPNQQPTPRRSSGVRLPAFQDEKRTDDRLSLSQLARALKAKRISGNFDVWGVAPSAGNGNSRNSQSVNGQQKLPVQSAVQQPSRFSGFKLNNLRKKWFSQKRGYKVRNQ